MTNDRSAISSGTTERSSLATVKVAHLGWLLVFNALFFQSVLQDNVAPLAYIDEAVAVFMLLLSLGAVASGRIDVAGSWERTSVVLLALYVVVCLIGNFASGVQLGAFPILVDMVTCCKFFVVLLASLVVFDGETDLLRLVVCEGRALVFVMFACAVINLIFGGGMSFGTRYGLRSFKWIFFHPFVVNAVLAGLVALFATDARRNRMWIYLALATMCLTLRSVGIGSAALAFISVGLVDGKRRFGFSYLVLVGAAVAYLGFDQFEYYYTLSGGARLELTRACVLVANDYAPLGSGFATFGSNITATPEYYSWLYYRYGLSNVWGLQLGSAFFLSDAFWPVVIAQGGWLGSALFIGLVLCLFGSLVRWNGTISLPVVCTFGYMLISTVSSSSFFHPTSVFVAFCLGLALGASASPSSRGHIGHLGRVVMWLAIFRRALRFHPNLPTLGPMAPKPEERGVESVEVDETEPQPG